jgi:hypothetical protein
MNNALRLYLSLRFHRALEWSELGYGATARVAREAVEALCG